MPKYIEFRDELPKIERRQDPAPRAARRALSRVRDEREPCDARLPPGVAVLERGWLSSNNIVFAGRSARHVVDTRLLRRHRDADARAGAKRAAAGGRCERIVNTHLHSDHCGGNAALQAAVSRLRTLIPPGLAGAVRDWDEVALSYRADRPALPAFPFRRRCCSRARACGWAACSGRSTLRRATIRIPSSCSSRSRAR